MALTLISVKLVESRYVSLLCDQAYGKCHLLPSTPRRVSAGKQLNSPFHGLVFLIWGLFE